MSLSYSEAHGHYVLDDILQHAMPQTKLTDKNAIILNCKDPKQFQDVYEKTIQKHFSKQIKPEPVLKMPSPQQQVILEEALPSSAVKEKVKKPFEMQPEQKIVPHQSSKDEVVEELDQEENGGELILDTKCNTEKKVAEDEFKKKLQEIAKRNEEEAK